MAARQGPAARRGLGHPKRAARRERAQERAKLHVCSETCKRFRTGREKWIAKDPLSIIV